MTVYFELKKRTDDCETISELPYHIGEEVKELLNEKKENRRDWRGVASRMEVKTKTIEKIENDFKKDPTEKLFKEISNEKITKLLQILYQMERNDVLNVFYREKYGKSGGMIKTFHHQYGNISFLCRAWKKHSQNSCDITIVTCCKQDTHWRLS